MNTPAAPAQTFTFPSGTTVDLPAGMTPCASAGDRVTEDRRRFRMVGVTPAGNEVWSYFTCAAYARAAHMQEARADIARLRTRAEHLATERPDDAARLRDTADRTEQMNAAAWADWASDPAPCTCPPPA